MLNNEDRDNLMLDILKSISMMENNLPMAIRFAKDRFDFYKNKMDFDPELEIKTQPGNGMYECGDYIVVDNPYKKQTFRGKILEKTRVCNRKYIGSEEPGYKVMNLSRPEDIRFVPECEITLHVDSSMPPPLPIRKNNTYFKVPKSAKVPKIQ